MFLPADTGTRDALAGLGKQPVGDPTTAGELAQAWRPWRSYAQVHLWRTLTPTLPTKTEEH
jgi:AraC family transcriptional regulator of adaptative response / DNA-3-methyladenine glycosylase II